jgi:uncharacterized Zn-finger protein
MVEYICDKCKKIFDHKSHYIEHINRKRPCVIQENDKDKYHFCDFCDKRYNRKDNLTAHLKKCKNKLNNNFDILKEKIIDEITKNKKIDVKEKFIEELTKNKKQENVEDKFIKELTKGNKIIKEKNGKTTIINVTITKEKKKPIKRKTIPKTIKNQVWNKYIGAEYGIGECYVCSNNIDSKHFECGHIIADASGGEVTVKNLRPVCSCCNKSIGSMNMDEFKNKYFNNN